MAAPQIAPLPPNFELASGMQVVVTAIDATTGNTVSGVVVSNVSIDVDTNEVELFPAPTSPVQGAYTSGGN